MAEIVNLREFRKKKKRRGKAREAARNRAKSGRSKTEKLGAESENRRDAEAQGKGARGGAQPRQRAPERRIEVDHVDVSRASRR